MRTHGGGGEGKRRRRRTLIGLEEGVSGGELALSEAIEDFLEYLRFKGLAYHTRRWHRENIQAVEKELRLLGHPVNVNMVTEGMLREAFLHMVDRNLSPTTISHRMRSMKALYAYLEREGKVKVNPAQNLERRKPQRGEIQAFTEEQVRALLGAPDRKSFVGFRDYVIMLVLLDTGVRLSELVGIKLEDLRLKEGEMVVKGKGGKVRRVYLTERTKGELRKYLRIRGEIPGNRYLFVTSDDRPMNGRNVQERLSIYGRKAGIEGVRVSPHTFRHTFAKMYIMNGGDPFSLQAILGHSTLDMVKQYVNLWGRDVQLMHRRYSPLRRIFGELMEE